MTSTRKALVATAVGVPLAFVALLAVEALIAGRAEYAPDEPGMPIQARVRPDGAVAGPALRMIMLGDSTVAGLGVTTVDRSLAVQTAQRVADRLGRPVEVRGLGVSGARVDDVLDHQVPQLVTGAADVVVIVIGSNDVTHLTLPGRFDDATRRMLTEASERSGDAPVVLGGIPLFGEATALAQPLRAVVDLYANRLRGVQSRAAEATPGASFVNIAAEASPRFEGVPDAMSEDGFHPAARGYGFWADALAAGVVTRLEQ